MRPVNVHPQWTDEIVVLLNQLNLVNWIDDVDTHAIRVLAVWDDIANHVDSAAQLLRAGLRRAIHG